MEANCLRKEEVMIKKKIIDSQVFIGKLDQIGRWNKYRDKKIDLVADHVKVLKVQNKIRRIIKLVKL